MDNDALHEDAPQEASAEPLRIRPLSVGALLTETRAAAGRELADVARETRVPLRHLMAIEADDHQSLPALPYALGFAKSYARVLGLDPEAVAAQFRAETSLTPHVPAATESAPMDESRLPPRSLAWASLGLLAVIVVALGLYGAGVFDPPPPPPVATASPDNGLLLPPPAPAAGPDALPAAPPVTDPATLAPAGAAVPAAPVAAAPVLPTAGPVALLAREDVWVKIYDRSTGRRAFMGVLAAGQQYDVPAGSSLTLRAGKAGVIDVRVAGVKLPPLGGPVQTIDGVLLTAPALAARFDPNIAPPPVEAPRRRRLRATVQVPASPAAPEQSAPSAPTDAPAAARTGA
jgi:cytoskeleton protein RodZ